MSQRVVTYHNVTPLTDGIRPEDGRRASDILVEAERVVRRSIATLHEVEDAIARERAYLRDRLQELQYLAAQCRTPGPVTKAGEPTEG